jgi:hypothetical protein
MRWAVIAALFVLSAAGCGSVRGNKAGRETGSRGSTLTLRSALPGDFAPGPTWGEQPKNPFNEWSWYSRLVDRAGRTAGHQENTCVTSPAKDGLTCFRVLVLARGEITAQVADSPPPGIPFEYAVTGGTGAYEGARGTIHVTGGGPRPEHILVRLLPAGR